MTWVSPSLTCLRAATREAHRRLEDELGAVDRLAALPERRSLIRRYYDMYCGAARLLAPWLQPNADLDPSDRQRLSLMSEDLRALGLTVELGCCARPEVEIASRAEALGFRYVIEGSALGGRVLLRQLDARGADLTGLRFLDPNGASTGEAWRRFLGLLERELGADATLLDHAVSGALKGFAFASTCLCGNGIAA